MKQRTLYPKLYWLSPPSKPVIARLGTHQGRRWAVRLSWPAHEVLPPAPERFAGLHVFERHEDARAWTAEQIDARLDDDHLGKLLSGLRSWWRTFSREASELIYTPEQPRSMQYNHVLWGFDRPGALGEVGTDG